MDKKKAIAALGLAAALGAPAAVFATTGEIVETKAQVTEGAAELIVCPQTGELIPPCCCPENKTQAE